MQSWWKEPRKGTPEGCQFLVKIPAVKIHIYLWLSTQKNYSNFACCVFNHIFATWFPAWTAEWLEGEHCCLTTKRYLAQILQPFCLDFECPPHACVATLVSFHSTKDPIPYLLTPLTMNRKKCKQNGVQKSKTLKQKFVVCCYVVLRPQIDQKHTYT